MVLIDKGYYDYDFERIAKQIDSMENAKTDEEIEQKLSRFGFCFDAEKMQEEAMNN